MVSLPNSLRLHSGHIQLKLINCAQLGCGILTLLLRDIWTARQLVCQPHECPSKRRIIETAVELIAPLASWSIDDDDDLFPLSCSNRFQLLLSERERERERAKRKKIAKELSSHNDSSTATVANPVHKVGWIWLDLSRIKRVLRLASEKQLDWQRDMMLLFYQSQREHWVSVKCWALFLLLLQLSSSLA